MRKIAKLNCNPENYKKNYQTRVSRIILTSNKSTSELEPAKVAMTIISLTKDGTLSVCNKSGLPIGIHTSYTLNDDQTIYVELDNAIVPKDHSGLCSLLLHSCPLGQVTLVGTLLTHEPIFCDGNTITSLSDEGNSFVITKGPKLVRKILVDSCHCLRYYVSPDNENKTIIAAKEVWDAQADSLSTCAQCLVSEMNNNNWADINRMAADALNIKYNSVDAEMLWIDQAGLYLGVYSPDKKLIRIPFSRVVRDKRDACSILTMLSQVAWERESNYKPVPKSKNEGDLKN
jgi:hypothetical protein